MNSLTSIDTTMPVEAADSPIWDKLAKRGRINIATSENTTPINIYYEVFGSGPERVVFINGKLQQAVATVARLAAAP
ncbi:hypothetical protein H4R19_001306 [Coemansia spiralis]|nr:hypothetical protein H4R19_001306 [Coemansia spiralis]